LSFLQNPLLNNNFPTSVKVGAPAGAAPGILPDFTRRGAAKPPAKLPAAGASHSGAQPAQACFPILKTSRRMRKTACG
jgi:hypothetical protein